MLFPQNNHCRAVLDLSGFWEIKPDPKSVGIDQGWTNGFDPEALIGVPGSWNEQLAEMGLMNYVGSVWHQIRFHIPEAFSDKKVFLRIGSADFNTKVWINGEFAGEHNGGYLPFEFDITTLVEKGQENILVVCVDNTLSHESIPQGVTKEDYKIFKKESEESYPPTAFDFFAYGGIHRPVKILAFHEQHLDNVRLETAIHNTTGHLKFEADFLNISAGANAKISLWDGKKQIAKQTKTLKNKTIEGEFTIRDCHFWSHASPHLYNIRFELFEKGRLVDEYQLETGIRAIKVEGMELLLNGKPIFLKGFGKHEDFSVLGKGLSYPLIIKDFQLMKWIGANSFRTAHYPYAEEVMQMADKFGFLVIDEVPAVSLNFRHANEKSLENHKKLLAELIARDRNHPSVISWSIGNEPGIWMEQEAHSEKAEKYWTEIYNHVKALDSSRPITLPTVSKIGDKDLSYKFSDFISINRYWGWYEMPTDLEKAGAFLKSEMEGLFNEYQKPILVSEFGADTIEGEHATFPQLFTEEYQTMFIKKYFEIIESLPFAIGEHIWNFADFRTAQHCRRVVLNKKGVFNRQREPKAAAFAVREHWLSKDSERKA